jgi:hypothetical protein
MYGYIMKHCRLKISQLHLRVDVLFSYNTLLTETLKEVMIEMMQLFFNKQLVGESTNKLLI